MCPFIYSPSCFSNRTFSSFPTYLSKNSISHSLDNSIRIGSTRKNVKNIYQEYVDEKNDNYSHFCIQDINIDFTYKNDEIIKIELEKA